MKFNDFYRITLNTALSMIQSAQLNPWTKMGAAFALGALRGKGVEGITGIPLFNQLIQYGAKLGLVTPDDTVDLPNVIAGLENMVAEGKEVDLGFIILDSRDVKTLIANLRKEQPNVERALPVGTEKPLGQTSVGQ